MKTASIVGYARLSKAPMKFTVEPLRSYCRRFDSEVDIVAEERSANDPYQPNWHQILNACAEGKIKILVVPNLHHIAGRNILKLTKVLDFLSKQHVQLIAIQDRVDSNKDSTPQIIFNFLNNKKRKDQMFFSRGAI